MMKALVISSETDTLRLLDIKLSQEGYEVFSARTADDGLKQVRKVQPTVIILDPQVIGEQGMGLISDLKREPKRPPVVLVLSSETEPDDIDAAFSHGADDFVGMPFSPQGLLERMEVTLVRTGRLPVESEES